MHPMDSASMERNQKPNALIVDKEGSIGKPLAEAFSEYASTVFVSYVVSSADSPIIHIPFSETIPAIPDGFYSYMLYMFSDADKDLLEPLMKKAAADKIKFFIVVRYEQVPLLLDYLSNKLVYGHVVVLGDAFGDGKGEIDEWLSEIKRSKKIVLSSMGLNSWYPVLLSDAVSSLVDVCVSSREGEKQIYLLAPAHPITQLTIAHALQKSDPMLRIDFSNEGKQVLSSLPKGKHVLEGYSALEKITTYYQDLAVKKQDEKVSFSIFSAPISSKTKKKEKGSSALFVFYTLIVFICMPVVLMLLTGVIGKWLLLSGVDDIKRGALPSAQQKIAAASSDIALSQFSLQLVNRELSILGQGKMLDTVNTQLSLANSVVNTLQEGVTAGTKIQAVLTGKSLHPEQDAKDGADGLKATLIALQQLQTEGIPQEYKSRLSFLNTYAPYIETLVENLPQLLGAEGERKYLVLFQNNTELRPGGGFIGSYGVLQLSHGKFKGFTIHDVYDADGQLKGHVEPSFAIRRYMPLVHLYLRDSNFDVDFSKDADKAAFMLKAETGEDVDGVLGIDLSFVQTVIGSLGSLYVPAYNVSVTKDNFFLLAEQHAEKNSFPGSTQKKDFLSSLFNALQDKLLTKGVPYENLLQGALQGIDEKHVLFAVEDPSVQASLSVNGLSSALMDSRVIDDHTLNDFFGINEANIGVDKVNYYIKRNVEHKVSVSDNGQVNESVSVTYTNSSDGTWPGGIYKNYLRFILPKDTTLDTVAINGIDQKLVPAVTDPQFYELPNFVAPKGLEVEKTEENGKTLYAFLVSVPVKSTTQVSISYTLNEKVNLAGDTSTYSLELFKQPGVDVLPYSLEVTYPQGFSLLKTNQKVTGTNTVSFNQNIVKDTLIEATLLKK